MAAGEEAGDNPPTPGKIGQGSSSGWVQSSVPAGSCLAPNIASMGRQGARAASQALTSLGLHPSLCRLGENEQRPSFSRARLELWRWTLPMPLAWHLELWDRGEASRCKEHCFWTGTPGACCRLHNPAPLLGGRHLTGTSQAWAGAQGHSGCFWTLSFFIISFTCEIIM